MLCKMNIMLKEPIQNLQSDDLFAKIAYTAIKNFRNIQNITKFFYGRIGNSKAS